MKVIHTLILLFASMLAFAQSPGEILKGRAIWIFDGDTFLLLRGENAQSIRLWGIDTPESDQPGGEEATQYLIDLIGRKHVTVKIVSVENRSRRGRAIGKVYLGERDVNLELIKAGHAWHYAYFAPEASDYAAAEKAAREKRIGIWRTESPTPPWEWRQAKKRHD